MLRAIGGIGGYDREGGRARTLTLLHFTLLALLAGTQCLHPYLRREREKEGLYISRAYTSRERERERESLYSIVLVQKYKH